jgi:predicted XRE-type DNA-binding protein
VANSANQAIRATKIISLAKTIKRMRYDQRQIVQVLLVTPEKAQAIMEGRLDGFSTAEITKFIGVLD